jgi:hypothetical protein
MRALILFDFAGQPLRPALRFGLFGVPSVHRYGSAGARRLRSECRDEVCRGSRCEIRAGRDCLHHNDELREGSGQNTDAMRGILAKV